LGQNFVDPIPADDNPSWCFHRKNRPIR
jgi:hypothetical protein